MLKNEKFEIFLSVRTQKHLLVCSIANFKEGRGLMSAYFKMGDFDRTMFSCVGLELYV